MLFRSKSKSPNRRPKFVRRNRRQLRSLFSLHPNAGCEWGKWIARVVRDLGSVGCCVDLSRTPAVVWPGSGGGGDVGGDDARRCMQVIRWKSLSGSASCAALQAGSCGTRQRSQRLLVVSLFAGSVCRFRLRTQPLQLRRQRVAGNGAVAGTRRWPNCRAKTLMDAAG